MDGLLPFWVLSLNSDGGLDQKSWFWHGILGITVKTFYFHIMVIGPWKMGKNLGAIIFKDLNPESGIPYWACFVASCWRHTKCE